MPPSRWRCRRQARDPQIWLRTDLLGKLAFEGGGELPRRVSIRLSIDISDRLPCCRPAYQAAHAGQLSRDDRDGTFLNRPAWRNWRPRLLRW